VNNWVALGLVAVLIAANAVFVAAEFSLVAVRRAAVEEQAGQGDRRATRVLAVLGNLSLMLSAAQFGITVTSLLVGFLAEQAIGDAVVTPVFDALGIGGASSAATVVVVAFVVSTTVQMVVGELVPKNIAIARPLGTSLAMAGPMHLFGVVFGPVIRLFDNAAAAITSRLGIEVSHELDDSLSRDELARIINASQEGGVLTDTQADLLQRAVGLSDTRAGEIMLPRPDVVWLDAGSTLEDLRRASRSTGFSRFPIRGATDDDVLGTVHLKDLLTVPAQAHATTAATSIAQQPLLVPESEPVARLLARMRRSRRTFAVVLDEYGGTAGIVTAEDILEELVGEIEDEFDREVARIRRIGPGRFIVQGGLRADRLGDVLSIDLGEGEFETVAGFVLDRLGHIPELGEYVDHEGWRFEVTRLEGVRVRDLRVWLLPTIAPGDAPEPSEAGESSAGSGGSAPGDGAGGR